MKDKKQSKSKNKNIDIADLEAKCQEHLNGWKRAMADYANLKREMEEKQKDIMAFACGSVVTEFIPVYDNFKKATQHIPDDQKELPWVVGITQIKKQFEDLLKQYDIEEIKTTGESFNPEFHEAVGKEKKDGTESDMIISEVSSGYTMKGKVIIPAKVIVSE